MPDEKIPLQTSAAKEIDPNGLDGTALGEQENMAQDYNQASYEGYEQAMQDEGRDSEQVGDESMDHDLKPPPEIAEQVDKEAHKDNMQADHEGTMKYNESMDQSLEDYLDDNPDLGKDGNNPGNELDYGNDM